MAAARPLYQAELHRQTKSHFKTQHQPTSSRKIHANLPGDLFRETEKQATLDLLCLFLLLRQPENSLEVLKEREN
jgi:hypothetical protein